MEAASMIAHVRFRFHPALWRVKLVRLVAKLLGVESEIVVEWEQAPFDDWAEP